MPVLFRVFESGRRRVTVEVSLRKEEVEGTGREEFVLV